MNSDCSKNTPKDVGATLPEYALLIALLSLMVVAVLRLLGVGVSSSLNNTNLRLTKEVAVGLRVGMGLLEISRADTAVKALLATLANSIGEY